MKQKIIRILQDKDQLTRDEMCEIMACSWIVIDNALTGLLTSGRVARKFEGLKTYYFLTQDAHETAQDQLSACLSNKARMGEKR